MTQITPSYAGTSILHLKEAVRALCGEITRAPLLYAKTRNVGELTVENIERGRARLVVRGWPGMTDRQLLSLCANVESLLERTGRNGASAHAKRTSDGGVIELRWT